MTETPIINGNKQFILIRGESNNNPVLLYLHGGPGTPDFFFVADTLKPLEKLFTICYWEQRGAGRSYATLADKESLTLEQMILDAEAVSQYLLQKFGQTKIYVLGQSWGTFLGSMLVQRCPGLFHAYLSVGQVTDQYLSELESYSFVKDEATIRGDKSVLHKLKTQTVPARDAGAKAWLRYLNFERWHVARYRGSMRSRNIFLLAIWKLLTCRAYSLTDKLNYMKGSSLSFDKLWTEIITIKINDAVPAYQIPVYFFHGVHDHHTYYEGAKNYFEKLTAPKKQFYTFPDAAHFPHVECFEEFERIVREEVLAKSITANYYVLEPEVPGGLGENTVLDTSVHPPIIHHLHYQFDGWLGDDILEGFPCFFCSDRLAEQFRKVGLKGFYLEEFETSTSDEFKELFPETILPKFYWLKITGVLGDDFLLSANHRLVVSEAVISILKAFNIAHCDIVDYQLI